MARVTIRVDKRELGLLHRRLDRLTAQITEGAREAVSESADVVRDDVATHVRVDTGRLREQVRVREIGTKGLTADVGWFDHDTYYEQFNEFGTSSISADPVLTRAGEVERGKFPRRVQRHVNDRL